MSAVQPIATDPAQRVDRALDMLRAHLLDRTIGAEWNEQHAHEVARAIVTCLRDSSDIPADGKPSRAPGRLRAVPSPPCRCRTAHLRALAELRTQRGQ